MSFEFLWGLNLNIEFAKIIRIGNISPELGNYFYTLPKDNPVSLSVYGGIGK